ncbi:MAG TPA: glycosyltransferase family 39 protein [Gemmatimonadaceae bacterium]|nr:glycosyltransferase family 39 protein [Gemmatimonadaceae bacterium]
MTDQSTFSLRNDDSGGPIFIVIALGAIARFVLAATVGLGVDESYAVAVARQFSLSYFDHPPLHFWIAGIAARLAHSEMPEVVRFPFVLCFAGTTWFTWRLARRLFGDRAAIFAAVLLNVSAVFSLSTGGWVLPDGPLMLCMIAAADVIAATVITGSGDAQHGPRSAWAMRRWCLAGLLAGLAMLCKYHGAFVLAGAAVFLATSKPHRHWLRAPGPYVGTLIAFACFTPVLIWNGQHGWASFAFQGSRAASAGGLHVDSFLANIGGQAAWVLPWIFVPLAAAAWRALRAGPSDPQRWFLLCLAGGPIAVFTLVSLGGNVGLPHWQAPGWLFVFPILGAGVAERVEKGSRAAWRWMVWSAWGYVALIALVTTHASVGWLERVMPSAFAHGDPTGDLATWKGLRQALARAGFDTSTDFIATTSWIQAGKASIGAGPSVPVLCLCADPHHFYYLRDDRTFLGRDAMFVHKVRAGDDVRTRFAPYFASIEPAGTFVVTRGPEQLMTVELLRARGFRATFPTDQPR